MRQDRSGIDQAQAPVRAGDRDQGHRCDGVRPARFQDADAGHEQELGVPTTLAATPVQKATPADHRPTRTQKGSPDHH